MEKFDNNKKGSIPSLYYIENFISNEEEKDLFNNIYKMTWRNIAGRRVQSHGGNVTSNGLEIEEIPDFLIPICNKLLHCGVFENLPNHILINEYDGDQGIMHHKDGPAYFPRVVIITLEGSTCLSFKEAISEKDSILNIILFPQSLLIFENDLYHSYLHGIENSWDDIKNEKTVNCEKDPIGKKYERTTRVSLTIRYVQPKVKHI